MSNKMVVSCATTRFFGQSVPQPLASPQIVRFASLHHVGPPTLNPGGNDDHSVRFHSTSPGSRFSPITDNNTHLFSTHQRNMSCGNENTLFHHAISPPPGTENSSVHFSGRFLPVSVRTRHAQARTPAIHHFSLYASCHVLTMVFPPRPSSPPLVVSSLVLIPVFKS